MKKEYIPSEIEPKWQQMWQNEKIFEIVDKVEETVSSNIEKKEKYYILDMFPYPSGEGLHVGHPKGYVYTDIIARHQRMLGKEVLHPMGLDSFGLPAENFAIKKGIHPSEVVDKNSERFYKQLEMFGFSYDWSRKIRTSDPDYYKWTQWIFLKLYENDLAYESDLPINWCPSCKTGISNEEVVKGKCERCQSDVTKKKIRQWVLNIRKYADRLLDDLEDLDWPDSIIEMQKNWIGRSEGAEVNFQISNSTNSGTNKSQTIPVFTTRPDTLFGATFIVLSPEHELVEGLVTEENKEAVQEYIQKALNKSNIERKENKEKTGIFTGSFAINPISGQEVPIWIADYVLSDYGTGAIMAVPAHDQRDYEFAHKFDLPITQVIDSKDVEYDLTKEAFTDVENGILINSGEFDGMSCQDAIVKIIEKLVQEGKGKKTINYQLNDWLFSRQRYWGEPIPLVHCKKCGIVPIPYEELPLKLPEVKDFHPTDSGESPLANVKEWVNTTCPKCNGPAKRETNTMPQWAGSCWYYLRFIDPHNDQCLADPDKLKKWLPVDFYVGGAEHAVLHLLYARFWHKFLYDIKVVPTKEPFVKLQNVGLVMAEDGTKMSKSKGNVVNPDDMIKQYGADTFRAYEMFMGPFSDAISWDTKGMQGVYRFLNKVWNLGQDIIIANEAIQETPAQWLYDSSEIAEAVLAVRVNKAIKKITEEYKKMSFNTVISHLMIFTNDLIEFQKELPIAKDPVAWRQSLEALLLLLSPSCPHIAEELWHQMGHTKTISLMSWPTYDEELIKDDTVVVPIQVNGKRRGEMVVQVGTAEKEVVEMAKTIPIVQNYIKGKEIVKEIYVNGKIVNIVVK